MNALIHGIRETILAVLVALSTSGTAWAQDEWENWDDAGAPAVEIHGFVEGAAGGRTAEDPSQANDLLLNEARFRLDLARYLDRSELHFKGDFVADGVTDETTIDVRRAIIKLRPASWLDVVAGRQVLTWGTGDLVFLNDLFAKDFVSFFIGRDDEFLKAPSNSFKATFYADAANLDVVWTPSFTSDAFISGERLSFYRPAPEGSADRELAALEAKNPKKTWANGEFSARLFRTIAGYELAAYGYGGFFKQPTAMDTTAMMPTFAELTAVGASARGNLAGGIANVEVSYYDSRQDRDGGDPLLPNSQFRTLGAYERELATDLTVGLQYYGEYTMDHDSLVAALPMGQPVPDEARHVVTARLTRRLMQQTLIISTFVFYSPNDEDGHVRLGVTRDWSDAVGITLGANLMWGDPETFFGQLEDNSNVYVRVRAGF